MKDLPRTTGNVFFIYANAAAGSSPTVRVAPSISAKTGLASMTGGLDNENLEITPNGSGGFDVELKVNQSQGFYHFSTSVTTNGDSTHEAAMVSFTFYVVLVGSDQVFDVIKREYRVGDEVNEELQLSPANGVHDYRVTGGSLRAMDVDSEGAQYSSGITLSVRTVGQDDEVWLTGRARRPGCYLAWLDCTTWDEPQYGTRLFGGGGNLAAPVIVSIRDRDVEPGVLCLMVPQTVDHNDKALRLVMCDDDLFPVAGGWFKVRLSEASGVWAGEYSATVWNGTEHHQYRVELDGVIWKLKARVWTDGGVDPETPPDWSTLNNIFDPEAPTPCGGILATAPAITGTEWTATIPPSSGWSDRAVLTGDTWYNVPGQGMFDYKGEYEGRPVYQEQCIHTRQYAGWDRASEYQNNAGRLLWQDGNGKWNIYSTAWVELVPDVSPFGIDGAAIPYAPPVMEKIGSDPVRDLSFAFDAGGVSSALNVNHAVSTGALALFSGNLAGGAFGWFDAARLIVPYNGSGGDPSYQCELGCKVRRYVEAARVSQGRTSVNALYYGVQREHHRRDQTYNNNYKSGGEVSVAMPSAIPFGTRSGAVPVLFGSCPSASGINAEHYISGGTDYTDENHAFPDDESGSVTSTEREQVSYANDSDSYTSSGRLPVLTLYPFAAPDAKSSKWHQRWFAARLVGMSGTFTWTDTKTTHYSGTDYPPEGLDETEQISGSIAIPDGFITSRPMRFDGFKVAQTDLYKSGSFSATAYSQTRHYTSFPDALDSVTLADVGDGVGWYQLSITNMTASITKINGADIVNSVSFHWKKSTRPAGTFSTLPALTVTEGDSTDPAEYAQMVSEAKELAETFIAPGDNDGDAGEASFGWSENVTVDEVVWEAVQ